MKALLATVFLLLAAIPATAQRPYVHEKGTAAYNAARNYEAKVIQYHNQWRAGRIGKMQYDQLRGQAYKEYIRVAFPPPPPPQPSRTDNSSEITNMEIQIRNLQQEAHNRRLHEIYSGD